MGDVIQLSKHKLRDGGSIHAQQTSPISFSATLATQSPKAGDDVWNCVDCPIRDKAIYTDEVRPILKRLGKVA